ncbi:LamG-like jellyroll fold domain-containing protein [Dongia deserti]|uniref:LamG-like jellyroll fold domain-containing protein n=1 Tax=Dongia deserti TaxID=2268030 RepID=UPI000E64760E|nr:LamG-like jellyroll fold domain-containing protein [Dongia deserti]
MSYLNDRVLDEGLEVLTNEVNRIDICSALPATYLAATSTFSLGNRLAPSISAPAARSPSGREVTIAGFNDGLCTGDGDAAYWALVDTVNSRLLAAGAFAAPFATYNGAPFRLGAFPIGIPGAVITAAAPATPRKATITIASGEVAADLTDFPVMVRLSDMASIFWSRVKEDGGDIRVKTTGGALVPIDLARFDYHDHDGVLFFKAASVLAASDNEWEIHYGNHALNLLPATDTNGRNAVWSDYESVFLFGETSDDRTGGDPIQVNSDPNFFEKVETSPDLNAHQGATSDGTHYYVTDTNRIKKYDLSWTLVAENTNPISASGISTSPQVDHCGAPEVHDGKLYIPIEYYQGGSYDHPHIAVFDASDLSFIQAFNIDAQGHEASGIAYCPVDGLLYVTDYVNSATLYKYDPVDGSYEGSVALTAAIGSTNFSGFKWQGIAWWRGAFWLASDEFDETFRVLRDGTVYQSGLFGQATSGDYEGVGSAGDALAQLVDGGTAENVSLWKPIDMARGAGGGVDFAADANLEATGRASLQTYTLGATIAMSSAGQNRTAVSYWRKAAGTTNTRQVIAYRSATPSLAIWDVNNSWLEPSPAINPTLNQAYRVHAVYEGTTRRRIYVDGALKNTQTTINAVPSTLDTVLVGREDDSNNEQWRGKVGFVYLRAGALSADWIAAEYSNVNDPGGFYSIGGEQVA